MAFEDSWQRAAKRAPTEKAEKARDEGLKALEADMGFTREEIYSIKVDAIGPVGAHSEHLTAKIKGISVDITRDAGKLGMQYIGTVNGKELLEQDAFDLYSNLATTASERDHQNNNAKDWTDRIADTQEEALLKSYSNYVKPLVDRILSGMHQAREKRIAEQAE